jgi:hypothetical protein
MSILYARKPGCSTGILPAPSRTQPANRSTILQCRPQNPVGTGEATMLSDFELFLSLNMKAKLTSAILSVIFLLYLEGCCRPDPDAAFVGTVDTIRPQQTVNWCWAAVTQMLAEHLGFSTTQCALANQVFGTTNCCQSQTQPPCLKEQQKVDGLLKTIADLEPTEGESPEERAKSQKNAAPFKAQLANAQAALASCRNVVQCPKTDDCNKPGWLELDRVGAKASETTTALSYKDVKNQISCDHNPIAYAYGTPGTVGHVVVINGYFTGSGRISDGTDYVQIYDPWSPCVGNIRLITYSEYSDPAGTATHWNTWFDVAKK